MEQEKESGKGSEIKIFAVKVTTGYENTTAFIINERYKAVADKTSVVSALVLDEIKSYVMVEAKNMGDVLSLFYGLKHVKGQIKGMIDIKEIEHLLVPKEAITDLKEGYEVEIIFGPFKGNIAEIIEVDKSKNEVTVILKDAVSNIPIHLSAEYVKVIKK
jgi:transcriptional antiterminator NusG